MFRIEKKNQKEKIYFFIDFDVCTIIINKRKGYRPTLLFHFLFNVLSEYH